MNVPYECGTKLHWIMMDTGRDSDGEDQCELEELYTPENADGYSDVQIVNPGVRRRPSDDVNQSQPAPRNRGKEKLNTQLLDAAQTDNLKECTRLLNVGAEIDAKCRDSGATALMVSAAWGHEAVVSFLLEHKASPLVKDKEGRTPAHVAAARGNDEALRTLIEYSYKDPQIKDQVISAVVEVTDSDLNGAYDSWLHQHSTLLPKMPELSAGSTPLHAASQYSRNVCVTLLLDEGADPEACDSRGLNALDVVGEVEYVPDEEYSTGEVKSAFSLDIWSEKLSAIKEEKKDDKNRHTTSSIISKFLRFTPGRTKRDVTHRKPKPETRTARQISTATKEKVTTFLHTAVRRGDENLIKQKLEENYNVLEFYEKGLTPAHVAVEMQNAKVLQIFLDRKDENITNARDTDGRSLLYMAVKEEWKEGIDLLLDAKADIKLPANDGTTVIHVAAGKKNPSILFELLSFDDVDQIINVPDDKGRPPLFYAVEESSRRCVEALLRYRASPTVVMNKEITLLHVAAKKGSTELLEILLNRIVVYGEKVLGNLLNTFNDESEGGMTPLHESCKEGHVDCVKLLLKYGAGEFHSHRGVGIFLQTKCTRKPYYGATPLHLAARYGHADIAAVLIEWNKVTLFRYNADKWQPLHIAARFGKTDCVRLLLKAGSSLAKQVSDGSGVKKTALDMIVSFIPQPVEFLQDVLDSYISTNDYSVTHADCVVNFDFTLLAPCCQSDVNANQLLVLDAVINSTKINLQEVLLLHPLAETFLFLKWRNLRKFFFLIFALYCVFTISLTLMCLIACTDPTAYYLKSNIKYAEMATAFSLVLITFQELFQAVRLQHYYWTDTESWIKWATLLLSGYLLSETLFNTTYPPTCYTNSSSIVVLLAWIEFLFLLSRLPNWGFSVLMFCRVAQNVVKVLATFVFLFVGFTFAFMIEFRSGEPFTDIWRSLVKVIVMTSEMEYSDMFETPIDAGIMWPVVSRCIFISFVILITLVLMNLMVGVAVNDITVLEAQGRTRRLAKQVSFLSFMEMLVSNRCISSIGQKLLRHSQKRIRKVPLHLKLHTGKPREMKKFPTSLRNSIIEKVCNIQKSQADTKSSELAQLTEKIDKLMKQNKQYEEQNQIQRWDSQTTVVDSEEEAKERGNITLMLLHQVLETLTDVKSELNKAKIEQEASAATSPKRLSKSSFKKTEF